LDNIATIFVDLYKDQLKSTRSRAVEYPFNKYFDQQVRELEDTAGPAIDEHPGPYDEEKKDLLVSSDNGGPPPPYLPPLLKGTVYGLALGRRILAD
jgi:signal recognition particle receptor subunit alpha